MRNQRRTLKWVSGSPFVVPNYRQKYCDGSLTPYRPDGRYWLSSESARDIRHFPRRVRFVPTIHIFHQI